MNNFDVTLPAPCKLNLCLKITGRREDGYHELQTVFQLLDYGDTLRMTAAPELSINSLPGVPAEANLALRAARALADLTDCRQGARLQLTKRVPSGAGLGGGSSDAATVLLGLNALWDTRLSEDELAALGRTLGADVPVFVKGHSAWAEGVGERLEPMLLPERWYLVVQPGCQISTREIFSHPDLTRHSSPITIARFLEAGAGNDCEAVVRALYPEVGVALEWLSQWGAAKLTGTGSCVFVAVEAAEQGQQILASLPRQWSGFCARGVNRSGVLDVLASLGLTDS